MSSKRRLAVSYSRFSDPKQARGDSQERQDDLFRAFCGEAPQSVVEKEGLKPISDAAAIERLVDEVLAANAKQVEDYRAGKEKAFNSLVGQVMKASKGKAHPAQVSELLRRKLGR